MNYETPDHTEYMVLVIAITTPNPSLKRRGNKSISSPARGEVRRGGSTFVDCILFMTVYPGQNGAAFQKKVIPKIIKFHAAYPNVPIAVDGGINEITLTELLKAGVTRFAVGSAIWSDPNPLTAYKKLLKVVGQTR